MLIMLKLKRYSTVHNTHKKIESTHDKIESNMMMLPWTSVRPKPLLQNTKTKTQICDTFNR